HRQLGDGPVAPDRRHRHLRLERCAVLLPCPLHVLLPRYPRFLGAGLHLSHLSHFRGPAHGSLEIRAVTDAADKEAPQRFDANLPIAMTNLASLLRLWFGEGRNRSPT